MRLSKSKVFLILLLCLVIGIFAGKYFTIFTAAIIAAFFIVIVALFWQDRIWRVIGLGGIIFILGIIRFNFSIDQNDYTQFLNKGLNVAGTISEDPDQRADKTLLTLVDLNINNQEAPGKILLTTGRFPEFSYGQKISFRGKIKLPQDAENAREFSYKDYLSRFGIWGTSLSYDVREEGVGKFNSPKSKLVSFKHLFVDKISQILPEPQNSFLAGLLVGMRRSIPKDITDNFATTGITHIIALSGYNITIIAVTLERLLAFFGLRRKIAFWLSLSFIGMFVIMSGASASVVRAGIMGAMILIATNIGRIFHATNALVFTAGVMLLHNPQILHFDVGFQLSFMSFAGLIYFVPILEKHWHCLPKIIKTSLFPTIAAQIFTIPLLLYYFSRLSVVSVLVNMLVLPVVPIIMGWGFTGGFLALVSPYLAMPLVWFCWVLLSYILKVVEVFASLSFASIGINNVSVWLIVFYYIIVMGLLSRLIRGYVIKKFKIIIYGKIDG